MLILYVILNLVTGSCCNEAKDTKKLIERFVIRLIVTISDLVRSRLKSQLHMTAIFRKKNVGHSPTLGN